MVGTVSRRQCAVAPRASSSGDAERSDASSGAGDTHAHRADAQRAGVWLTAAAATAVVAAPFAVAPCALADFNVRAGALFNTARSLSTP
ncbi:unnamed protein product [Closterium sp. NIES-53]